jgi:5-methylcytosine-specific restriction endonuclease McrA
MYIEANKDKFKLAQQEYQKKNKESVRVQRKIYSTSPALYNTYAENLNGFNYVEEDNNGFLITKCTYCGKKFHPTNKQVSHRLWAINNVSGSENNLYCSNSCKEACPTFWQRKRRKDEKPNIAYETLDPYVRQAVFERDEYKCQKCGKTNNKGTNPLHAHLLWKQMTWTI